MERDDTARLSTAEGRRFGLVLGAAFVVLAGVLTWRGHTTVALVVGSLGGLLGLAGLTVPRRLGPVQRMWMGLGHAISRITNPVLMGMVYFLVIAPTGWLRRTFGRDPLHREPNEDSYWIERSSPAGDLERQF